VAERGAVARDTGAEFDVGGTKIAVFNHDGMHALESTCAHQDGSIAPGEIKDGVVECPLHFWHYDIKTGRLLDDSEVTPRSETEDAQDLAGRLGIAHRTVDIAPIVRELARHVEHDARALGNARARIRMCLLYHHANASRAIVVGTSDRSECLIGYFTKHGDGAADVLPIASLYKTQVRAMAGHLGLPAAIAEKKSAPHLWEGHDAEGELGMTYEEIDAALHCIVDRNMGDAEAAREARVSEETVARVRAMREASAHKRAPAPGACGP